MSKHCLYCYQPLAEDSGNDFHERCSLTFFGDKVPPMLSYTLDQMAELAKNIVERRIAVPGVQPKLSLTLVKEVLEDGAKGRLTIVNALGGNYIFKPPHQDYDQMPENEQQHFSDLASGLGLNSRQISATYKMFSQNKPLALEWLDRSFLSDQKKEAYKLKINERYARLGL